MIVVTMTSWIKRINNVKPVLESILDNTLKPNKIFLNLSVEEFPDRENNLPHDLVELINSCEKIILNWVEGENTKTMKKVFPILDYLNDEDIIINCDDDMLFPRDLIQCRVNDFIKYGMRYCVSGKQSFTVNFFRKMYTLSPTTLFQKKMLKNWEKVVDDHILKTYNDDRTYIYILWLNGYQNKPCTCYEIDEMRKRYNYNVIENAGTDYHLYPIGNRFDRIMIPHVEKITGEKLENSFGFFKNMK